MDTANINEKKKISKCMKLLLENAKMYLTMDTKNVLYILKSVSNNFWKYVLESYLNIHNINISKS